MGRSQVKYRSTHGRGRGRGRGEVVGGRDGASGRGRSSHLRNLGSNAYRFEEREEQDDSVVTTQENYEGRTQFFASEQNYRDHMGAAPGAHFQSCTMKQWEEKDDAADDLGVLDLNWIASQLELVSPDLRYRMDPKYCIDLPFETQNNEDAESEKEIAETQTNVAATIATLAPIQTPSKPTQDDAELDFLLNLSASTSSGTKSTPTPSMPADPVPLSTRTPAETEQLEDWLDDVLDM
ncbi:uncharacterized protein PITG_02052 [Phytophthora infestans T30-4]|uniref:Cell death regulator Aven n=1 Tax=Phytophthora infestans (strain T30-4) TaxID=403677 RepID=D0MUR9_PHYIT|nr:uncharacterized protein PITG_02052 [Phytophthora infestans T30-4]EEY61716.1 conserved hypothetical protein [Phytophthora infestans T30-4]KAI9993531.1 hypothetical protein PInf_015638 [Phytophthora infestans]KAI9993576.1 hypothetical protein PInf_015699 [Phytophthora infestans]|eukprot:XP_002908633.1 conserved hypothetical protein [Phytophthora infestans T30-4]